MATAHREARASILVLEMEGAEGEDGTRLEDGREGCPNGEEDLGPDNRRTSMLHCRICFIWSGRY